MIRIWNEDGKTLRTAVETVAEAKAEVSFDPTATIDPDDLATALKAEAVALVVSQAEAYGERLTAGYPLHEILSWPVKVVEAKAIMAGETDPALFEVIAAECLFTGANHHDAALQVLAKARPFAKASGAISGIRQEAIKRINAARDEAEIAAGLTWARAAAEAAFGAIQ